MWTPPRRRLSSWSCSKLRSWSQQVRQHCSRQLAGLHCFFHRMHFAGAYVLGAAMTFDKVFGGGGLCWTMQMLLGDLESGNHGNHKWSPQNKSQFCCFAGLLDDLLMVVCLGNLSVQHADAEQSAASAGWTMS